GYAADLCGRGGARSRSAPHHDGESGLWRAELPSGFKRKDRALARTAHGARRTLFSGGRWWNQSPDDRGSASSRRRHIRRRQRDLRQRRSHARGAGAAASLYGDRMTNRQQWTLVAGIVMTAMFGVALAIKLRPQISPLEIGSTAPEFQATNLRTNRPT